MASGEIDQRPHKYWPSVESLKAYGQKTYRWILFVDFTKAFDSIHRGEMEQILLAYGLPKETVAAIMILYRNTKVKVRSPDGDADYFDIVAGVLQRNTLAPYHFIICLDYVLGTSIDKIKENDFELKKKRRYPAKTITNADYADDIGLLANVPAHAETLLHSLERAAAGIGPHVNAHKTKYMCFNQTGDISTLNGNSLKQVDKFTYQGSSFSFTGTDIDTRQTKVWTATDRLSVVWKSDQTDKWSAVSSKQWSCRYCDMDALHGRWLSGWRKSLTATTRECCEQYLTSPGGNTPQSSSYTATYHPLRKLSKLDEPDIHDTAGEAGASS